MSQQIQITGGAKVRNLEGVLTGTSGVVNSLGINVPDGIPQLDGNGKILVTQLPNSVMEYKGVWNVSTNTPTLANGTGNQGDVYLVEGAASGGTAFNFGAGPITFFNGDQVVYSGSIWQRASGSTGTVTSVAVTESGDALTITGSPITNSGTINIGFSGNSGQYINGAGGLTTFPTDNITGSGAAGQVSYFSGTNTITSEAAFNYDASTNRLGINTSVPNATIGANAGTDSGYSLLLKNSDTNYNGIGFGTDSTYGNLISTEKLGTAPSRNLTLLNQSGYVSLTEAGNLGVNILNPNTGVDIYNSTSAYLWLHTATSGVSGTDGVRLALFNTNGANLRNFDGSFSITAEGDFSIITLGAENFKVNSADGSIYQSKVANAMLKSVSGVITAAVAGTDYLAPSAISGTTNTIAKFASSSTIGNSNITDTGSLITLGSTTNISSGNFGVGTSSPAVAGVGIDIYSATSAGLRFHTATSGTTVSDGAGINFSAGNNLGITNYEAGAIDIVTNGNSGVYINSSGYVGISGATPSTALTVNGAITQSSVTSSLLKTNSSGTIIAAVAGTDYVAPSALSGYLPLTGGTLTGPLGGTSANFTGDLTVGSPASALAQFHIYNASAAASMLVQTNSSTDYAEIAARNYNSVATAYYRQYSSSASGTDFGVARGNLAALFSNYASNFAIGTQNGGDLILGTANTERMRIAASTGNVVIGSDNTTSNRKLVVYSATADTHLAIIGTAPSVRFTDNFTATYSSLFGMATSNNNYVTGSVAGDFMITYNSSNNLIFGNSNTSLEKMRLNSSGNLLINTTSGISGVRLQVTDTAPILGIQSNTTGSVFLRMYQGVDVVSSLFYNAASSTLTLSNNNAGIQFNTSGVTNAFNLSSTGAATFSSSVTAAGRINSGNGGGATASLNAQQLSGDDSAIYAGGVATAGSSKGIKILAGTNTSDYALNVASYANSPILYARGDGNVGIGTSSPGAKLQIVGAFAEQIRFGTNTSVYTNISMGTGFTTFDSIGGDSGAYSFRDDGQTRMFIDTSGNVGIGTSSPAYKLDVNGTGNFSTARATYFDMPNGSGYNFFQLGVDSFAGGCYIYDGTNSSYRMVVKNNGNVLINNTSNTLGGRLGVELNDNGYVISALKQGTFGSAILARVDNTNSDYIRFFYSSSNTQTGSINTNGTTTSYNTTSDYRLKEDLKEIKGLEKVSSIKVYNYKWKSCDDRMDGVLAHELQEIIPYAVTGQKDALDENGNIRPQGVDYSKLVPVLVKAIQEQQAQIEELKALIQAK